MTAPENRLKALGILDSAVAAGARARGLADLLGVGLITLQRWRRQFADDGDGLNGRKGSPRQVYLRLTDEKRQRILLTCNQPEFAALPPGQIVPILADRGLYNSFGEDCVYGSERSFHRVLHAQGQVHRRGRAGGGPDRHWSRQQGLPAGADQQGSPQAADPPCRQRQRHACRHAGKPPGGAGCAQILLQAKAEQRQPLLGIAVPHCVDAGPRSGEYRPDYPRRPFQSVEQACAWVAAYVDWYNHQHRHSGIRFVTPDQRHRGQADAICQQRARVYEQARQRYPRR